MRHPIKRRSETKGQRGISGQNFSKFFAEQVRFYREQSGLTQFALSRIARVNSNTIARIERAEMVPTVVTAQDIALALRVSLDVLCNGEPAYKACNPGYVGCTTCVSPVATKPPPLDASRRLHLLLIESNIKSLVELSKVANISRETLHCALRGERISWKTIFKLSKALGVPQSTVESVFRGVGDDFR